MEKLKLLFGKQTTDDYPYGRLRCTRTIETEYKKGKGYRIKTQTINPKTGRINNPKLSTYSDYIALYEDGESGHTKAIHFNINGTESIDRFIRFLKAQQEHLNFTTDQSIELWATIISSIKIGAQWTKFKKSGEDEKPTAIKFIEACGTEQMIEHYRDGNSIMILADNIETFTEIEARYKDNETGESIMRFGK